MRQNSKAGSVFINNSSLIFLAVLLLMNCLFTSGFLSVQTLWNLCVQITPIVFVALGMTFIISSGGIDISVGSTMAVSGMLVAQLIPRLGLFPALLISILCGGLIGMLNGVIIAKFRLQPIIVTLGTQIAGRGIAQLIGSGYILRYDSEALMKMATQRVAGVPVQFFYVLLIVLVFVFLAKKSAFSRYVEAMGDNYKASWISGVRVNKYTVMIYTISGIMSACAGILTIARAGAADPDTVGSGLELTAIAAVAIGDTKMTGGKAKMLGTILGALILQIITITFNMNNVPYEWSLVAKTFIIILAVFLQNVRGE